MSQSLHYQQNCLGVVLAGGKSSRMGKDKAQLTRISNAKSTTNKHAKQQNMLSYSRSILQQAGCSSVVISGDQHGIADCIKNAGPIGGIYSIMTTLQPQSLLILPVDLPLISAIDLQYLKQQGELSQQACFYQQHALPLYLPNTAFLALFFQQALMPLSASLSAASQQSKRVKAPSIRDMLKQIPHTGIKPKDPQRLFNTNTPEQWQQATKSFNSKII